MTPAAMYAMYLYNRFDWEPGETARPVRSQDFSACMDPTLFSMLHIPLLDRTVAIVLSNSVTIHLSVESKVKASDDIVAKTEDQIQKPHRWSMVERFLMQHYSTRVDTCL
jgi:hypothetical protein